jgi:N-acetylglutamate synthase/N-acetylornithine aminotransferase
MAAAQDCARGPQVESPIHEVFIGSTGVIDRATGRHREGAAGIFDQLSNRGGAQAARAILTTDLKAKSVVRHTSMAAGL